MEKPERRSRVIVTRVTEKEYHELLENAKKLDISFSELVRVGALMLARQELKS